MKDYLGFNNKYGRPIPYVWFIIFAVSSLPLLMMTSITSGISCDEISILNGRTQEEYSKQKGFTIQEAVAKCSESFGQGTIAAQIISVIFFIMLTFTLKPWPLSNPQDEKDPNTTQKRTPI